MSIIAKYKFNPLTDVIPIFNDEFVGYTTSDIIDSDGNTIRTISHASNKPTKINFAGSSTLLEVYQVDTEKLTTMQGMFQNCSNLTKIENMDTWETREVTTMASAFASCASLSSLNLSNFNTEKVTNLSGMFMNCRNLKILNLSSFNTSNVVSFNFMLSGCSSLVEINLSNWNISLENITTSFFNACSSLEKVKLMNVHSVLNINSVIANLPDRANLAEGNLACSLISSSIEDINTISKDTLISKNWKLEDNNILNIKIGSSIINYIFLGDNFVNKVYLGDMVIFCNNENIQPDIPGTPSNPNPPDLTPNEPEQTIYNIEYELGNSTISNNISSIEKGGTYAAYITPNNGYEIEDIIVTMGGVDITESVVSDIE